MNPDSMDLPYLLASLARLPEVLRSLVGGLDSERARWKPSADRWSVLEVLGHLVDEEREDFGPRLLSTLEDPKRAWAPIDPEARVVERDWNANGSVEDLLWILTTERASALARLRVAHQANWTNTYQHGSLGPISAADLLLSWVNHDLLHLRQMLTLLHELSESSAREASSRYAGDWGGAGGG